MTDDEHMCNLALEQDIPDICTICGCHFKHRRYYFRPIGQVLYEVRFITCHARCKKIKNNVTTLTRKLMDAEFELFAMLLGKQG